MSARERLKGARGERELVELLVAHGWTRARRNFQSGGQGGGDIAGGPAGYVIECKRHRGRLDLPGAMRQAHEAAGPHDVPVVAHRRDGAAWYATLPLEDLLVLIAFRERA